MVLLRCSSINAPTIKATDSRSSAQTTTSTSAIFHLTARISFNPVIFIYLGIKRLLTRTNHLDAMDIQTKHIAHVVCSFLAAAVPITIVKIVMLTGICLVKDGDHVLCTVRPDPVFRTKSTQEQVICHGAAGREVVCVSICGVQSQYLGQLFAFRELLGFDV
jgi:hypothetical protein